MPENVHITNRLREAAPEICGQIAKLRKERRIAYNRYNYLHTCGNDDEATEMQQPIYHSLDTKICGIRTSSSSYTRYTNDRSSASSTRDISRTTRCDNIGLTQMQRFNEERSWLNVAPTDLQWKATTPYQTCICTRNA